MFYKPSVEIIDFSTVPEKRLPEGQYSQSVIILKSGKFDLTNVIVYVNISYPNGRSVTIQNLRLHEKINGILRAGDIGSIYFRGIYSKEGYVAIFEKNNSIPTLKRCADATVRIATYSRFNETRHQRVIDYPRYSGNDGLDDISEYYVYDTGEIQREFLNISAIEKRVSYIIPTCYRTSVNITFFINASNLPQPFVKKYSDRYAVEFLSYDFVNLRPLWDWESLNYSGYEGGQNKYGFDYSHRVPSKVCPDPELFSCSRILCKKIREKYDLDIFCDYDACNHPFTATKNPTLCANYRGLDQ